jgi:hypothetical protein
MIRIPVRREQFRTFKGRERTFPLYTIANFLSDLGAYPCDRYYLWTTVTGPRCIEVDREQLLWLLPNSGDYLADSSPIILSVPYPGIGIAYINHGAKWPTRHPLHWANSGDQMWVPKSALKRRRHTSA